MATNDYLPEHIIFKILSFLPVISLLRCKSVCKSWLSIISNSHFIQTHLRNSNAEQSSLLNIALIIKNKQHPDRSLVCIQSGEYSSSILLPPQFSPTMTLFIGYCNGLVCLGDYFHPRICVWNPSIKRFKLLPTPNKKTDIGPVKIGFGYDYVCDDYKVVRILCKSFRYGVHVVEAELYSVNADCWKEIELPEVVQNAWPLMTLIHVRAFEAVLYLVGVDVLVSFDLHNEVFEVYPYPKSVNNYKKNLPSLIFEGSVAMIFKTAVGDESVYSLWTLDNVCGNVCWSKKLNLEPALAIDEVHLYLGSSQFVALDTCDGLFWYDLKKKETRRVLFPLGDRQILSAVKFTNSLVSLQGFEQIENYGQ